MRAILFSFALGLLLTNAGIAAGGCGEVACCEQPQCSDCCCKKVCQVVCEMKKVKKHCWVVECEEFCVPLPGFPVRCGSPSLCPGDCCSVADCGCVEDVCTPLQNRRLVPPLCGPVRCRKKLVKKEIICEVPVYKCVVVECGAGCGAECVEEAAPQEAPAPDGQTTGAAPLPPPVISGVSYLRTLGN